MTTTPDQAPLTLAELDDAPSVADPERLPELPTHPGWGSPRGTLWGAVGIAHGCLAVLWPIVSDTDRQEDGPEVRRDLAQVYERERGLSLSEAFACAAQYLGPRTEVVYQRATALADAARVAMGALAGDDDNLIEPAQTALSAALNALSPETTTDPTDEEN